ncbi:MAG: glycosyltransferase family 2 protein [Bacteroidetes bacterium]|nr:glycosyltransferase family 2 protein [Bacteroidota bacterium]
MVSIILPTFNRASLVMESIQSVLEQSYRDFELIIIDDGSADDTKARINSIQDDRIRYYWFPHSGYTGRLKNFALQQAQGELIAFIDSDDMWKPGKLEQQVSLLNENPSIGFSITDVTTFKADIILIDHSYQLQHTIQCTNIFEQMKENRFLVYPSTLILRKSCFETTGYFDESMLSGDFHFNMRLAYHFDAGIIYETMLWRRVHDSNMSEQIPFENYGEFVDTFDFLYNSKMVGKKYQRQARSIAFYKMGKMYASLGNTKKARHHFLVSLKNKLYNPPCIYHLLNTWFPSKNGTPA